MMEEVGGFRNGRGLHYRGKMHGRPLPYPRIVIDIQP